MAKINFQGKDKTKSTNVPISEATPPPPMAPPPPGWTGAEVTFFSMLHPVFGHNYCTMASLIRTKSCHAVYEYAQLVMGDALPGQGVGRAGKKKKRNMRYVERVLKNKGSACVCVCVCVCVCYAIIFHCM